MSGIPPGIPPGSPSNSAYLGTQGPGTGTGDFPLGIFMVDSVLNMLSTATLVQVKGVSVQPGSTTAVGTVDVQPCVNQIDGYGNATPHGKVYKLAYFRYQGGANAVICDPQVGDIGVAVIADRDTSSVRSNAAPANPGSRRRWRYEDGIYFGLAVGGANPNQTIKFTTSGIEIDDKNGNKVIMMSSGIQITAQGNVTVNASGNVVLNSGGRRVARVGDTTTCPAGAGRITSGAATVLA